MTYLFETEEHAALRAQVRRFAATEIAPHADAWEEREEFPLELYKKAADAGVLGVGYPEALGGGGGTLEHTVVAAEEMVLAGRSVGVTVGLGSHGIALPPILRAGTEEQQRRFIPPVLRGEKVSALAITEPGGGSDVAGLRTRAVRDGDHYVVDGAKTFITSGVRADLVTVAVRTGGPGHGGVSLIVVERGPPASPWAARCARWAGARRTPRSSTFDGCRVPAANLIGEENMGFVTIAQNFAVERVHLAVQCVAIAQPSPTRRPSPTRASARPSASG
jgi:acyl-CoA dehydrogenase